MDLVWTFLVVSSGKLFAQIEPRLRAEHGIRARAGAVGLEFSVFENVPQQIEVLNHRGENLTTKHTKDTKRNLAERKYFSHRLNTD